MVKARRNRAHRLFGNVCSKMIAVLQLERFRELAIQTKFSEQSAIEFFNGEYIKAQAGVEPDEEDDAMKSMFT